MKTKKIYKSTTKDLMVVFIVLLGFFSISMLFFTTHSISEENEIIAKNTSFFALYKVFRSLATVMFIVTFILNYSSFSFGVSKYKTDKVNFLFKRSKYYFLRTLVPLCLACLCYYLHDYYKPDLAQFSNNVIESESIFMKLLGLLILIVIIFFTIVYYINLRKTRNGFVELSPNYISWSEDGKLITKINKKEIKEIKIIRSSRTQEIENYQIVKDEMFLLNLEDLRLQVFSEIIHSQLSEYYNDLIIDKTENNIKK